MTQSPLRAPLRSPGATLHLSWRRRSAGWNATGFALEPSGSNPPTFVQASDGLAITGASGTVEILADGGGGLGGAGVLMLHGIGG